MSEPPKVNWDLVENDYRIGQMPIMAILEKYGITRSQLDRRVADGQWTRDLIAQVQASTNEQLAQHDAKMSTKNDMVEAAGETAANVILRHRKDIGQLRALMVCTMEALARKMSGAPEEGDQVVLNKGQGVIDGVHKLADTLMRLVDMERQAFNIADVEPGGLNPDAIRTQVEAARRELLRRGIALGDIEPGINRLGSNGGKAKGNGGPQATN